MPFGFAVAPVIHKLAGCVCAPVGFHMLCTDYALVRKFPPVFFEQGVELRMLFSQAICAIYEVNAEHIVRIDVNRLQALRVEVFGHKMQRVDNGFKFGFCAALDVFFERT